ncbi:Uncharacterised protein [Mycobacteroides abscessus]|nr:Uncharacterised protein [Mycobacteroides abscessus]
MLAPSSVRRRFSARIFRLYGRRSTPSTAERRKISYEFSPTSSVPFDPNVSTLLTRSSFVARRWHGCHGSGGFAQTTPGRCAAPAASWRTGGAVAGGSSTTRCDLHRDQHTPYILTSRYMGSAPAQRSQSHRTLSSTTCSPSSGRAHASASARDAKLRPTSRPFGIRTPTPTTSRTSSGPSPGPSWLAARTSVRVPVAAVLVMRASPSVLAGVSPSSCARGSTPASPRGQRVRTATASRWWVMGKRSNARSEVSP